MKTEVPKQLQHQADAIRKGAEMIVNNINDWQMIRQFLSNRAGSLQLTETQAKKLK